MDFEWDRAKADANKIKHGVSFEEASTLFGDDHAVTVSDPGHSRGENRYLTFGMSRYGRLSLVAHTGRTERIRITSSRPMTAREWRAYEQE